MVATMPTSQKIIIGAFVLVALGLIPLTVTVMGSSSKSVAAPVATPIDQAAEDTPATVYTPEETYAPIVPGPYSTEYEVLGHGRALVTYVTGQGFNEQQQTVTLPWTLPMQEDQTPRTPSVLAQLESTGTITCNIHRWLDNYASASGQGSDQIVSTATSSGAYVVATCTPPS